MNVAFMTSAISAKRGSLEKYSTVESMKMLCGMGFDRQDLSLNRMMFNESEFNGDNWENLAHEVRDLKGELGITFVQAHLPFRCMNYFDRPKEYHEFLTEVTLRAARICAIVGVEWVVAHPIYSPAFPCEAVEEQLAENHRFYDPIVKILTEGGCGVAFENLVDLPNHRRFGSTAAELNRLIDSYGQETVGACIDFGHANLMYHELEPWFVRQIGHRLRAIHLADNYGSQDDHMPPFIGTVKWEQVMKAVKDIGFDGTLVYETKAVGTVPEGLRGPLFTYLREIGEYLTGLWEEA
jgi:sugar phosphate isomerase/epimerase